MNDQIIGVAVLFEQDGIEFLMIRCQCSNGSILPTGIPVYPVGGNKVREHQWQYSVRGDYLDVTPSVNWVGVFHNAGSWSVKFVRFNPAGGEFRFPADLFRHLNETQTFCSEGPM